MPADRFLHPKAGHSKRVSSLPDFDYRVWTQYLMSADDFGICRATVAKFQDDNDAIEVRSAKAIRKAIDHLIRKGLVLAFEHQGKPFICQHDWQRWQKIEYPRATNNPKPPEDVLAKCEKSTKELLEKYPGGTGKNQKKNQEAPEDSPNVLQTIAEDSPPTRAGAPAKRLTAKANGQRLTADGSEGGAGETEPTDVLAQRLLNAYPRQGWCSIHAVTLALGDVLRGQPADAFPALLLRLEGHKRSARWLEDHGKYIPRLDRYLSGGTHSQDMPPPKAERPRGGYVPGEKWTCPHVELCGSESACSNLTALDPTGVRYPLKARTA